MRYVLEGSVRKSGGRARIAGQLIDATSGRHVWADRFDGELADIFDLRDRITENVVGAIEPSLRNAEITRAKSKPTQSLNAYDLYLRSLPRMYSRTGNDEALTLLERAVEIDASFALAKAALAFVLPHRHVQGWARHGEATVAVAMARAAIADSPDDPTTLRYAGHAIGVIAAEYDHALALLKRAADLNPNSADISISTGFIRLYAKQPETALGDFERAVRLSPLDPEMPMSLTGRGIAYLMLGRNEQALEALSRARDAKPDWCPTLRALINVLVRMGRVEDARATARQLLEIDPGFRVSTHHLTAAKGAARDELVAAPRLACLPE